MDESPKYPILLEEEPLELTEFDAAYDDQISALPAPVRLVVEKISYQLSHEGVTLDEACLLKNIDPEWLETAMEKYPVLARCFAKKSLEYKVGLFKPINKKAKTDDRVARFLVELREPKKRVEVSTDSTDMLAMAIEHIQESGDASPLVNQSVTRAVLLTKGGSANKLADKIRSLLPKNALS